MVDKEKSRSQKLSKRWLAFGICIKNSCAIKTFAIVKNIACLFQNSNICGFVLKKKNSKF